ncbi:MAG: siphovirus Gp157 family protein [Candidatus Sericytochromatia bacterium]
MLTLHEIKDTYFALLDILDSIDDSDEEQKILLKEGLKINEENFFDKVHNYVRFIHTQEKDIEIIESEIKRLNALKKSKQGKIDYLKLNLISAMQTFQKSKIEFPTIKLSLKKSSVIEIIDIDKIPEAYVKVKKELQPDKNLIKEALKNGESISGILLIEKDNLLIK